MGNAEVAGDAPEPFLLRPHDDLRPALFGDGTLLYCDRVSPRPSPLTRPQHLLRVEERHEGRGDDVYLAQAIPVTSAP